MENGNEIVAYKTEFMNGCTLTEYFNYYKISAENWQYIFSKLLNTFKKLWSYKSKDLKNFDIKKYSKYMYIDKTLERINNWDRKDILECEYIYANGEKLLGFNKIFEALKGRINKIISSSENYLSIIHGDSCFSNIIFFPQTGTFKFIDPRGNFGIDTVFGDQRYDLAKCRHNYHGLYDYITLSLFKLKELAPNNFEYSYFTNEIMSPTIFNDIIKQFGYDVDDLEIIEGLLFISMIPLHTDNKKAQILYYITGLKCLNNQFKLEK